MEISEKIFKAYDIRGVYPTELNEENIVQIIRAIYAFFLSRLNKQKVQVVLGSDMRVSSPSLAEASKNTLAEAGAEVIDVGLVSTPTFYFAVSHYGYDTGIQITASHNPKEYNGIKIVINSKTGLIKIGKPTGMDDVKKLALEGVSLPPQAKGTVTEKIGVVEDEVKYALTMLGNPYIGTFTVVADPANAMGALYMDALFKRIPGRLIKMNFELDGTFPVHQPDPLQKETLIGLQKRVISEKADLGLAPDGDGDRLFFLDEQGQIIPPTVISALVARELLQTHPGATILVDVRYIFTPQEVVRELGGKTIVTKVGHALITEAMRETGAIFAGESSAHFYFRETGCAEAPLPVILIILKVLTQEGKPLSQIVKEFQRSYESGEINFRVENASTILAALKEKYTDGELLTLDGVAISYPDWRFNVRPSNTEPLLRLNVEGLSKEIMEQKRDELIAFIQSYAS